MGPSCITGIGAIVLPCVATGDCAGAKYERVEFALAVQLVVIDEVTSVRFVAPLSHWFTGSGAGAVRPSLPCSTDFASMSSPLLAHLSFSSPCRTEDRFGNGSADMEVVTWDGFDRWPSCKS